jgi:hypothetical protein
MRTLLFRCQNPRGLGLTPWTSRHHLSSSVWQHRALKENHMDEKVVEVVELVELTSDQLSEVTGGTSHPDPIIFDH